jgi:CDGSH-type Zn-finger protein
MTETNGSEKKIMIHFDGPYEVRGGIPLVHKTQVVSEFGEPLTWEKNETIPTNGDYCLCRCGRSHEMPFCDGSHAEADFDGTETADTQPITARQVTLPGGTKITVRYDASLCMDSGFCGCIESTLPEILLDSADTKARSLVIAMIERCPSGAYTYSIEEGQPEIEPDYPQQVAVTTDITDQGPVNGALWITGGIPIERSDGQPLETRNRVTLCSCGLSKNKPLCDGAHRPK